ncbi:Ret finger protein-like 4B [Camelus dromedarius]|uniref:Ret finger protein-like 4B n=1 Tax=Camelus dromedarius TaxID=9838 RepID=A0A5N4DW12_CAMDR|nr:Ret finger protein-like 4B [Camelus dromedarius]
MDPFEEKSMGAPLASFGGINNSERQSRIEEWEDLKLTCPICREVTDNRVLEEWQVEELALLISQHGSLLDQSLHISDESVQCGKFCQNLKEGPQRFAYQPCVLGTPCFFSGSHYWEAEVGEGKEWALGVCKKSVKRKRKSSFSSEHGFCIISMKAGTIYTGSILETRIPASPGLSQVGIFLDTELEEIKFFDVRNDALIYIYSSFSCLEPLCPFFCPELPGEGGSGAPLIICPPEIHPFLEASCEVNEVFDVRNVRMTQEETVLEDL